MKKEKDLEQLLNFLEECAQDMDVIKSPYEVCIDCKKATILGEMSDEHIEHTVVFETYDHAGVSEWIRCLRWVLEK